ncbi:MAG: crossover junction endodeoxyribonuclease RuvC [Chloroflexota bacterium]|nr:crossover junction endodeoxyribonuclease RuvC [Chloroflexota bacterium]MDE2946371.1 crossover junction endodeoxyribonuclease RuvC [Chloroflexota bacterium]
MLTLGIDPGTASLGYGFVKERADSSLETVKYGVIRTNADTAMPERLKHIHDELAALIERYHPDRAAVEELFFARNVTTAITVAQARGVVLLALQNAGLPIAEYKPNAIKLSISGYGGAGKAQMQEMVRILLALEQRPRPDDAADALAVAITDLHSYRLTLANHL